MKNHPNWKRLIFIAVLAIVLTKGTAHLIEYLMASFPLYALKIRHVLGFGSIVLLIYFVVRPLWEELGFKKNSDNQD
jgi:hypothetical protein